MCKHVCSAKTIGNTRENVYNDVGAENNGLGKYEFLTQSEVGNYNYLCSTQGREQGESYLKSLNNTLNQRLGAYIAQQIKGDTAMGSNEGCNEGCNEGMQRDDSLVCKCLAGKKP